MTERWVPVPGYESWYEISDLGRVRSVDRVIADALGRRRRLRGIVLKHNTGGTPPYPTVSLCRGRARSAKVIRVHSLVLRAFVGPRPAELEIRHLNGDMNDARLVNLAYGTHSENMYDRVAHGTHHAVNKTHCVNRHEFTAENTMWINGGRHRQCRTCARRANRINNRKYRAQKRASLAEARA